ncbi:hypothetical protein OTB20_41745 [Streptomyces sp. H27-H1]|uniref:hypothetical protein n=1 Tax=Streptomyces sp. H27-H1 TaxID=2996461 RepID=UPI0022720C78|nr:hypothetical protein [Streptomyces sp. H27-H1]MCY0932537.1 hypothetical protein [Streptomyces sp. H27-H1]
MGYWAKIQAQIVDSLNNTAEKGTGQAKWEMTPEALAIIKSHEHFSKSPEHLTASERKIFEDYLVAEQWGWCVPFVQLAFTKSPAVYQRQLFSAVDLSEEAWKWLFTAFHNSAQEYPAEWAGILAGQNGQGEVEFRVGWQNDEDFVRERWIAWLLELRDGNGGINWDAAQFDLIWVAFSPVYGGLFETYAIFIAGWLNFLKRVGGLSAPPIYSGTSFAEKKQDEKTLAEYEKKRPGYLQDFVQTISGERKSHLNRKNAQKNIMRTSGQTNKPSPTVTALLYAKTNRSAPVFSHARPRQLEDGPGPTVVYKISADPQFEEEKIKIRGRNQEILKALASGKIISCSWYDDILILGSTSVVEPLSRIVGDYGWKASLKIKSKGGLGTRGSITLIGCPNTKAFNEFEEAFALISRKKVERE